MGTLLLLALSGFVFSMSRRWRLLRRGGPGPGFDRIGERIRRTLRLALGQQRLVRYPLAGLAHAAIFFGFLILLLRVFIMFGRGFSADRRFGYGIFDGDTAAGHLYALVKDGCVVLVALGVLVFACARLVKKLPRMTLSGEGLLILALIGVLMVADVTYDGAGHVLAARAAAPGARAAPPFDGWEPLGSILATGIGRLSDRPLAAVWATAFWGHVGLVLVFLNILPYSKHFHVITALPNVFFAEPERSGRLRPIVDLEGRVEREETLGVRAIDELSWKGLLDLYTCTECGRCTDHCPAARTGKRLSPKRFTTDLRDFLYRHQSALLAGEERAHGTDLVPAVIDPEVVWACTTCGACEQECPVSISYVDKIVDLRRHLVQEKGRFPRSLREAFGNIQSTGNPYGASPDQRLEWSAGLDVPQAAAAEAPEILLWVGCAPAIDERARGIVRAVARLLNAAGVRWATLGPEERCTGDVARRAGNEYLFQMMAAANVETLQRHRVRRILTVCPHCFNTLAREYPDFGGRCEVINHTEYLAQLLARGRLKPAHRVEATIAYHDPCYLGRHNGVYDPPRAVLGAIPGVRVVEAEAARDRAMCCGAGGGQMFKEEEPGDERVSAARTRQLLDRGPDAIGTACPFCMRMFTDALRGDGPESLEAWDVAEVLLRSVLGEGEAPASRGGSSPA